MLFKKLMTPEEFADYLRMDRRTIYRWLVNGELPGAFKAGQKWRIPVSELENIANGGKRKAK